MNKIFIFFMVWLSAPLFAQEQNADEKKSIPDEDGVIQKNTSEATINLRTTVMGNQEQPQVMYILPWQSPLSPELEMEMLGSEADAVFGHLERDELQRNLEAAGEWDAE